MNAVYMQSRLIFSLAKAIEKFREEYRRDQYVNLEYIRRGKVGKIKLNSILKLSGKYKGKKPAIQIDLTRVRDFIDYSKW